MYDGGGISSGGMLPMAIEKNPQGAFPYRKGGIFGERKRLGTGGKNDLQKDRKKNLRKGDQKRGGGGRYNRWI